MSRSSAWLRVLRRSIARVPWPSCAAAACAPPWSRAPTGAIGFDAYNVAGGFTAWHAQGLPAEPEGAVVADH